MQLLHIRAAHIDCKGSLVMLQCTILDAGALMENGAPNWIAVRGAGALALIDSQLSSTVERTTMLTLADKDSQALLRHCALRNITIDNAGDWGLPVTNLGIVHSTFDPPLGENIPTVGVSACALPVARREPMCDPRAICTSGASGGVQCRCSEGGLREKAESRLDGSECERMPALGALLSMPQIRLVVQKPGKSSSSVLYQLTADGEMAFSVTYRINNSLIRPAVDENRRLHSVSSSSFADLIAFGSRFVWDGPAPTSEALFDLNSARAKFSDMLAHRFSVELDCNASTTQCAADGDVIETIIEASPSLHDEQGGSVETSIRATSTVNVMVEALASCENTLVRMLPDMLEVLELTPLRVEVFAIDVDDLDIKYSRPEIEVWWTDYSGRKERLGYSRNAGTNRFVFEVPVRLVIPGSHDVVVSIRKGWNRTLNERTDCELLHRRVAVETDSTQRIVGFAIAGVLLLLFGTTTFLVYRNRHRAKDYLIAFLSFEGLVGFELCLEIWECCHSAAPHRPHFVPCGQPVLLACLHWCARSSREHTVPTLDMILLGTHFFLPKSGGRVVKSGCDRSSSLTWCVTRATSLAAARPLCRRSLQHVACFTLQLRLHSPWHRPSPFSP
jgi:hypothetical protein